MSLWRWFCRHESRFWDRRDGIKYLVCEDCGHAVIALKRDPR